MLRLPLKWGAAGLETVEESAPDDYAEELVLQALTIRRDFSGLAELDFDKVGTPILTVPNRNALKRRLEFLAYAIAQTLRERCRVSISGIGMEFSGNALSIVVKRRGARDASFRL